MSQIWDILKPISGVTKLSQLYQIIRDHNNSLRSGFSGTTAPSSPVVGQDWEDEATGKRYQYTSASGWSEVVRANVGMGLEIIAARGMHASLDSRLDAQINEDGTLKAATTLNPSQWYDLTVASGYISTTSFRAFGADYTSVYHPTRRLKVNNAGGASYTEVVSSSYSAPNTTVVVKDAVVAATLNYVSHSIIGPRPDAAGDGAVSLDMLMGMNIIQGYFGSVTVTGGVASWNDVTNSKSGNGYRLLRGNDTGGPTAGTEYYYAFTFEHVTKNGTGNRTQLAIPYIVTGYNIWMRSWYDTGPWSSWVSIGPKTTVEAWTNFSSFGSGWADAGFGGPVPGYMKDNQGFVHLRGVLLGTSLAASPTVPITMPSGYIPEYTNFLNNIAYDITAGSWNVIVYLTITAGTLSFTPATGGHNWYLYLDLIKPFKAA